MTNLVSLLFVAMIPIDCKITNFSLHLSYIKKRRRDGGIKLKTIFAALSNYVTFLMLGHILLTAK